MSAITFDDEALVVEKAASGDRRAFGELVTAYQRRAYGVAYGFVRNREDALELAQDSFVRAFKAMPGFAVGKPFYPWLHRIIRNACLNHLKKRKIRKETSLDKLLESGYEARSDLGDPEKDAELAELRQAIAAAIGLLNEEHREILLLRHFQEQSYSEIAECLEIPQGTVMSRLYAARRSLKKELTGKFDF